MTEQTAGILLTGGQSRRMGTDKALLQLDGTVMARRLGALLEATVTLAVEVGPGHSGLPMVHDEQPGHGPLVGISSGVRALRRKGWCGPAIVLACDLPLLTEAAVRLLIGWPGEGAVVPVVDGRGQPLCARWCHSDLRDAVSLARSGQRSLEGLPRAKSCTFITESDWGTEISQRLFSDVDHPDDFSLLGLEPPPNLPGVADPWSSQSRAVHAQP